MNISYIWTLPSLFLILFHIILTPYTKVEESFNIQASHDLLNYGFISNFSNINKFDHFIFSGIVPRSFIGSLFISSIALPIHIIFHLLQLKNIYSQYLIRMILGTLLWVAYVRFTSSCKRYFNGKEGEIIQKFMLILICCSFHLTYYMSRTLPNIFALFLNLYGLSTWLEGKWGKMIFFFTLSTIIFRCDTLVIFVPLGLYLLILNKINLIKSIKVGIISLFISFFLTLLIDSFFWKRILWPEGEVFYFNTILNKSSEWGIEPFHWYFTSALPRSLLFIYPLSFFGLLLKPSIEPIYYYFLPWKLSFDKRTIYIFIPLIIYIILYSFLPHKELRFIFTSLPLFILLTSSFLTKLYINLNNNKNKEKKNLLWTKLIYYSSILLLMISFLLTFIFLFASYHNYPGGIALSKFHQYINNNKNIKYNNNIIKLHIDPESAMTGISRFGQQDIWNQTIIYSKDENLNEYNEFDYLITSEPNLLNKKNNFNIIDIIYSFNGYDFKNFNYKSKEHIYIMKNKKFI